MDRDTVIALARQAEGEEQQHGMWRMHVEDLQRFANLIHDHLTWSDIHTCHPGCTKPPCVAMRKAEAHAAKVEREECAKICEAEGQRIDASWSSCAAAIRSRT